MTIPYRSSDDLVEDGIASVIAELRGEPFIGAAAVAARMQATKHAAIDLPLMLLEARLGLTDTEMRVMWLLLAHELDPNARALIRAQNTEEVPDVTYDVLRRFVYGSRARLRTWRELGPDAPLRTFGLIERTDGMAAAPEHRQTFKVSRRVLALAYGDLKLDPDLEGIARVVTHYAPLDTLELASAASEQVCSAVARDGVVIAHGRVGSGRRSLLSAAVGRPTIVVDAGAISSTRDEACAQLRAIAREARLLACVPLITGIDALGPLGATPDRIDLVESELGGLVLATSTRPVPRRWSVPVVQIEIPRLCGASSARLWKRALPQASDSDTDHLATMYPLSPALICAAGTAARAACGDARMRPEHIESGIRAVLDNRLSGLATRVSVSQTWDDLVIPDDQFASIVELLARVRDRRRVYEEWGYAEKLGRGLGVAALFSGPPGTGKTMAAGLIARELRCELYQVDTSKITSKWIGETEKNLAALFDAAEAGHAILLFDEADTLFGKRTDVKSSNDRHANQEVNFLLQRIESYQGMCILTTNHESAMDEAFQRRLAVNVRFPMPEIEERRHLWRTLIPASAPTEGELQLDVLADRFIMSGGHIRNAVLRAAFLAASEGTSITSATLSRAARLEYEAMGKIAPDVAARGNSTLYA